MPLWLQIGLLALTATSLLLHASHNKKLNDIGDDIDTLTGLAVKDALGVKVPPT